MQILCPKTLCRLRTGLYQVSIGQIASRQPCVRKYIRQLSSITPAAKKGPPDFAFAFEYIISQHYRYAWSSFTDNHRV